MGSKMETAFKSDIEIINETGMANLPLILYRLYDKYKQYELIDIGDDLMFRFGRTNVGNVSYLAVFLFFLGVKDNSVVLEGRISWPAVIKEPFIFYAENNGQRYDPFMSEVDYYNSLIDGNVYELGTAFKVAIPLSSDVCNEICFVYECNGIRSVSGKINSMRFMPVADMIRNQYASVDDWCFRIIKNHLFVEKDREDGFLTAMLEQKYIGNIKDDDISRIRKSVLEKRKIKNKPIWLFMDRLDRADDNGEVFFQYVNSRNVDVESYFIISKESPDYDRLCKMGYVVPAFSEEHYVLLMSADVIFSSQLNGWIENPFVGKEEYYRDLYHYAKVVFLQHGVTKDDNSLWLRRTNQNLFGLICSSKYEEEFFNKDIYDYSSPKIWNVGMPRFDRLYTKSPEYVLVAPTWRKSLMKQVFDTGIGAYKWEIQCQRSDFYFSSYKALINSKKLRRICREHGYRLAFLPHPLMNDYIGYFDIPDDVVVFEPSQNYRDVFAACALMITDYSSVAFDFAFLKRPVVYYQFDQEEFYIGHSYSKGYFDYNEMGFGPIAENEEDLLSRVSDILVNGMNKSYIDRIEDFFSYSDNGCCERLLNKMLKG